MLVWRCFPLTMVTVALATGAVIRAADDSPVDVRFQRDYKVGQVFEVTVTNTNRSVQQIETPDGASNRQAATLRIAMEAEVRVEKVDEHGQPALLTAQIRKLASQTNDDAPAADLLHEGSSVTITYADGVPEIASKKDVQLSDSARAALRDAFALPAMSDDVFGATEKKKGDTWPVNTKAMPYDRTNPQAIDPADLAGTVTLKDIRPAAGISCAQISATLTAQKVPGLPVEPREARLKMEYTASVPVDANKPLVAWRIKRTQHLVIEQKPLRGITRTTVDSESAHEVIWMPR